MGKNEIQRTAEQRSNGTGRAQTVKVQLNVRITAAMLKRLRQLSKKTGRSQLWLVEHAICQTLEMNNG